MTVGQTIQEHRKKKGLSQEELGQQLLVSRQTVSLWETDQTLPTIDNLIRLREIFGISVDELLGLQTEKLPVECGNNKTSKSKIAWSIFSWILLALSVFFAVAAFFLLFSSDTKDVSDMFKEAQWIFYSFAVFPLGCTLFGIIGRVKAGIGIKNIIAGGIVLLLLLTVGSARYLVPVSFMEDIVVKYIDPKAKPYYEAERCLDIDFPAIDGSAVVFYEDGKKDANGALLYSDAHFIFESADSNIFEKALETDSRWLTVLPDSLSSVVAARVTTEDYDYILIYNMDTEELNKLPSQSGVYRFICITYSHQDMIHITEYEIKYVK